MVIKILGSGCRNCKTTESIVRQAVQQTGVNAEIIKVEEMEEIMQYDIMATPAVVIDEKVIIAGRVPEATEILAILQKEV